MVGGERLNGAVPGDGSLRPGDYSNDPDYSSDPGYSNDPVYSNYTKYSGRERGNGRQSEHGEGDAKEIRRDDNGENGGKTAIRRYAHRDFNE